MTPNDVKIVANNIEDFIEVSDSIEWLRKALLTLAVSGKLVPQNEKEGTAEELFNKIQLERAKKFEESNYKKEFTHITREISPFDIPKSWKWVPFGSVFLDYGSGSTPTRGNDNYYSINGLNWYKSGELNDFILPKESKEKITELALEECHLRIFKPGDFLIAMYGATAGRIAISQSKGTTNQAVWSGSLVKNIDPRYLYYYILQSRQILIDKSTGAAQPNISGEKITAHPFALPPLDEQKRIVQKIEEVMKRIDMLEEKKKERDNMRSRLTRSAMQSLGNGESKIAIEHLLELIKTPFDLKELESALLTLAFSGKLVSQNLKEGSGVSLYNEIHLKKAKDKKKIDIEEKDKLYPIPKNWTWVRLEDVFDVRDGTHDSPKYVTTGYPLVTSKNLYYGKLDFLNVKYISETDYKKISERSKVIRDDILFAMIGSIGNPVIVDTDEEFSIKNVALFKYYDRHLSEPKFLQLYLKYASQNMRSLSAGGVQSFVSLGFLRKYPIPLPPLAEQKRIVKKIEEIMVLINKLHERMKE